MDTFIAKLQKDFPELVFASGEMFSWSPRRRAVIYAKTSDSHHPEWSLFHELGHALLDHNAYQTDLELVRMEAAAWDKAMAVARDYNVAIDPDHVQDCLDTYRDWLHRRSTCPTCQSISLQRDATTYHCHNCQADWHVSRSRLCRPYRKLADVPV